MNVSTSCLSGYIPVDASLLGIYRDEAPDGRDHPDPCSLREFRTYLVMFPRAPCLYPRPARRGSRMNNNLILCNNRRAVYTSSLRNLDISRMQKGNQHEPATAG